MHLAIHFKLSVLLNFVCQIIVLDFHLPVDSVLRVHQASIMLRQENVFSHARLIFPIRQLSAHVIPHHFFILSSICVSHVLMFTSIVLHVLMMELIKKEIVMLVPLELLLLIRELVKEVVRL